MSETFLIRTLGLSYGPMDQPFLNRVFRQAADGPGERLHQALKCLLLSENNYYISIYYIMAGRVG